MTASDKKRAKLRLHGGYCRPRSWNVGTKVISTMFKMRRGWRAFHSLWSSLNLLNGIVVALPPLAWQSRKWDHQTEDYFLPLRHGFNPSVGQARSEFKGGRDWPRKTIINIQQLVVKHSEIHYNENALGGSENCCYGGAKITWFTDSTFRPA